MGTNQCAMQEDIKGVLLGQQAIAERVAELGRQIMADYAGKPLLMLSILKGSTVFFADLIRRIPLPLRIDFMEVSSYGNTTTSGQVRLLKDLDQSCEGVHVLIVEDIIDSGSTLRYLKETLLARSPASLKICTLLDKPSRRKVDLSPEYCGFQIPDEFVVGYGLDYAERYRNLPDICILKPEIYG